MQRWAPCPATAGSPHSFCRASFKKWRWAPCPATAGSPHSFHLFPNVALGALSRHSGVPHSSRLFPNVALSALSKVALGVPHSFRRTSDNLHLPHQLNESPKTPEPSPTIGFRVGDQLGHNKMQRGAPLSNVALGALSRHSGVPHSSRQASHKMWR